MESQLQLLIILDSLDTQIKETQQEAKLGFSIDRTNEIQKAREEIVKKLDEDLYNLYERIRNRYGHAVVPTIGGICYGCFTALPTAFVSASKKNEEISRCPYCGRFLYWEDNK